MPGGCVTRMAPTSPPVSAAVSFNSMSAPIAHNPSPSPSDRYTGTDPASVVVSAAMVSSFVRFDWN
jgi:hypothetical protein